MAGGGVSSPYDPLDVTQYTTAELRAAVEAAENWGTYVTVHAYTPRTVRQALEAGVKCIDHSQLLDDATARLISMIAARRMPKARPPASNSCRCTRARTMPSR